MDTPVIVNINVAAACVIFPLRTMCAQYTPVHVLYSSIAGLQFDAGLTDVFSSLDQPELFAKTRVVRYCTSTVFTFRDPSSSQSSSLGGQKEQAHGEPKILPKTIAQNAKYNQ